MNDKPLSNPAGGIGGPAWTNVQANRAARRAAWKAPVLTEAEKRARLTGRGMSAARRRAEVEEIVRTTEPLRGDLTVLLERAARLTYGADGPADMLKTAPIFAIVTRATEAFAKAEEMSVEDGIAFATTALAEANAEMTALARDQETRRNMAGQERDEIAAEAAYDVDTLEAAQGAGFGLTISQNIAQTMRHINEHWEKEQARALAEADVMAEADRREMIQREAEQVTFYPSYQGRPWAERKERISRWLQNEVDWNEPDAAEKGFKITEIADRLGDALTLAGYHERPAEELDKIIGHSLDIMEDAIHLFFGVLP